MSPNVARAKKDLVTAKATITIDEEWAYTIAYHAMLRAGGALMFAHGEILGGIGPRQVNENLKASRSYRSDQGAVWDSIHQMSAEARVHSSTGAMRDVFQAKQDELDEYIRNLHCEPGQKGSIVFINGTIVGFDCLSLESAYTSLHDKLVKSYALEAILTKRRKQTEASIQVAKDFVDQMARCDERKYKSIGLGWDYRYEARNLVGSALQLDEHVIHTAFFPVKQSEKTDTLAGYHQRRAFRTQNGGGHHE